MYQIASTIIAFQIFLVLLDEILAEPQRRLRYWLLVSLVFVGSGTRAMMLPLLAGGVGLTMLASIRSPELFRNRAVMFVTILGGIAVGSVFFLGLGSGVSDGTKLLFINPFNLAVSEWYKGSYAPLVVVLLDAGVSAHIASLLYLIVAVCGRTTFLLPGILYALLAPSFGRDFRMLLGGIALSGIGLLVLVETVIPQEIWAFYWYADIVLALLGAAGLREIWFARGLRPRFAAVSFIIVAILFAIQAREFSSGFASKFEETHFPTRYPVFRGAHIPGLESSLARVIKQGDVLVTGGKTSQFDERVLPADVPGLQLYASRIILPVYAARTTIDSNVASRLWLMEDDLSRSISRSRVLNDVGLHRSLYLLWLGSSPPGDETGLIAVNTWPEASLWLVVGTSPAR